MKILIATDGSEFSKAAIDEASRLVRLERAEIKIISAYEDPLPVAAEPFEMDREYYTQADKQLAAETMSYLDRAEADIQNNFPGQQLMVTKELLRGPIDKVLIEFAKEWKPDLIVIGSHGRGFWGRLLGSVSTGLVHHAECSVLVVRKRKS